MSDALGLLSSSAQQHLATEQMKSEINDSILALITAHEMLENVHQDFEAEISSTPECSRYQPRPRRTASLAQSRKRDIDELSDESEEASTDSRSISRRFRTKSTWSTEEDKLLRRLVADMGSRRWSEIARLIPGRKGKQCRERWVNHLTEDMNKSAWTEEEDAILMQKVSELGTKWTTIAKSFEGRSENAIKNRYYASIRKAQRAQRSRHSSQSQSTPSSIQSSPNSGSTDLTNLA
eukprot:c17084_g1_i1.p1 GENE.c17084_g1_i1~~c17084_g1_i1.p1  ORF type:complete len:236 (+),score=22.11 c17084_g1_i1:53-760(+)